MSRRLARSEGAVPRRRLRVQTVLVVGQDGWFRGLRGTLETDGCRVVAARDAREALTVVARERADLVVLETRSPETVGNVAAEWMLVHLSRLPVVLCTASRRGCLSASAQAGDPAVAAVVRKSDGLPALRRAVARLCRGTRPHKAAAKHAARARPAPGVPAGPSAPLRAR
jgi:DNA-binding NtrC family response regulator